MGQVAHSFLQSSVALRMAAASPRWGHGQTAGKGTEECWFQFFQTEGEMNLDLTYFGVMFQLVKYNVEALQSYHCHSLPAVL